MTVTFTPNNGSTVESYSKEDLTPEYLEYLAAMIAAATDEHANPQANH